MMVLGGVVMLDGDFGYSGDFEEGLELVEDFWMLGMWLYWFWLGVYCMVF